MSSLIGLTNVHESNLTFKEIFTVYDNQFSRIRDYILALGGDVPPSSSPGSTTLLLDNFSVSGESIEVVDDAFLNMEEMANEVIARVQEIKDIRDEVARLSNTYEEYDERLQQKIDDYNEKKYQLEDLLAALYSKYTEASNKFSSIDSLSAVIGAYRQEVVDIRDSIVGISGLSPVELEDREVYLARNGASTLGARLNSFAYLFSTISEMRNCYYLKSGDLCIVVEGLKFFEVKTSVPSGTSESYTIGSTGLYACLREEAVSYQSNRTRAYFDNCLITPSLVEAGSRPTSVTVSWSTNVIPKSVYVTIGGTRHNLDVTDNIGSEIVSVSLTNTFTATFTCVSWDGATSSQMVTVEFMHCLYYGVKTLTELSAVDLSGCTRILDSKGSFTANITNGKYLYVFIPASVSRNIYIDDFMGGYELLGTKTLINNSGSFVSYNVYRTTNPNLGSVYVEVK